MIEVINKACGLDIHKLFFIATILSRSGEKQQQRFDRNDDGILALKNWVTVFPFARVYVTIPALEKRRLMIEVAGKFIHNVADKSGKLAYLLIRKVSRF